MDKRQQVPIVSSTLKKLSISPGEHKLLRDIRQIIDLKKRGII